MKHCTICGHQAEPDGQLQCACVEPKVDSMVGSAEISGEIFMHWECGFCGESNVSIGDLSTTNCRECGGSNWVVTTI